MGGAAAKSTGKNAETSGVTELINSSNASGDTELINSSNASDFKWPFKQTPEEVIDKFQKLYGEDSGNESLFFEEKDGNKASEFRLSFKIFERALDKKDTLFVIEPQEWDEITAMDLSDDDVRETYIDYFSLDVDPDERHENGYVSTGDGPGYGDPWYLVSKKLINKLFPSQKKDKKKSKKKSKQKSKQKTKKKRQRRSK